MKTILAALTAMLAFACFPNPGHASSLYDGLGFAYDVDVAGDYAYIANGYYGLSVVNIADRKNAFLETNQFFGGDTAKTIVIDDGYLYLANREGGTKIFSLSDPAKPTLVATYANAVSDTPSFALSSRLRKEGDILYIGEKFGGLVALDVSDPTKPVELDRISVPNAEYPKEVQGIDVSGNYAYVANPWKGMAVIDITDPTSMSVVANYDKPEGCYPGVWDVGVRGDYASSPSVTAFRLWTSATRPARLSSQNIS